MATYDFDLVCLGCGPAGEKAATQAAWFGRRVAVIERAAHPGGSMVNTGTVPSKALRETALVCSSLHRCPVPGVAFTGASGVSLTRLMAQRHRVEQQEHDRIEIAFDRLGVTIIAGAGRLLDARTIAVRTACGAERRVTARFILIATGSRPTRPAHVPFDERRVVDADGILHLHELPATLCVVGGGVIGCEYASIFAELGSAVTLVNGGRRILPFLDPEVGDHLAAAMEDRGVRILNGVRPRAISVDRPSVHVEPEAGPAITADVLLWAAGRSPNTESIGLEQAGVTLDAGGRILVDEGGRTSRPTIFAAGDVIGAPALASTSMEQGRIAACHMFGIPFKRRLAEIVPTGIYTIPGVSTVGLTGADARQRGMDVVTGRSDAARNVRARMLGDRHSLAQCIFDRATGRLLGATLVGDHATELIHAPLFLIIGGGGIADLIEACFNCPSLSEMLKYAAYDALQQGAAMRPAPIDPPPCSRPDADASDPDQLAA